MNDSIAGLLPGYLAKALCTTLVFSLWQGLLLAALAGIAMAGTRRSRPVLRYNLLMTALIVFSAVVTYTFVYHVRAEKAGQAAVMAPAHFNIPASLQPGAPAMQQIPGTTGKDTLLNFLTNHSNTIVGIWIIILLARALQLVTGLYSLYHLRRRSVFAVNEPWKARLDTLAQRLGIRQLVGIAESAVVKVPMVIGHVKPIILVPVGLLTALPPEEAEAILAHELAHIYRRDYLVNLLVSGVEILFFFNPAVLWMASLLRKEREHCCDDMVVEQSSSRINYIRALVSCQEYILSAPAYAMAFGAGKNQLKNRVNRMLSKNNPSPNGVEKSLLAIFLVTGMLLTIAFSKSSTPVYAGKPVATQGEQRKVSAVVRKKTPARQSIVAARTHVIKTSDTIKKPATDTINNARLPRLGNLQTRLGPLNIKQGYQQQQEAYRAEADQRYNVPRSGYRSHKTGYDVPFPASDSMSRRSPVIMKSSGSAPGGEIVDQIAAALVGERLADQVLSFKLTEKELVLNGKKIPNLIFQQFKNNHIESFTKGSTVYYNYDTSAGIAEI